MSEIITTRDVYPKRGRVVTGTSYFEMHIMLKEQERLEKEKVTLSKRMDRIECRLTELKRDLQMAEESMRNLRTKGR